MEWYRRASAQGHGGGQFNLGVWFAEGFGARNERRAIELYRNATGQGVAEASFNLGLCLLHGGVARDDEEAAKHISDAAKTLNKAQLCMGHLCRDGTGVP